MQTSALVLISVAAVFAGISWVIPDKRFDLILVAGIFVFIAWILLIADAIAAALGAA